MKKKFLAAAVITLSIFAITGCKSSQKQPESEILNEIEALPTNAIEDESEREDIPKEPEHELIEGEWVYTYANENDEHVAYYEDIRDIPRDFPINDRSTFGELSDVCKQYDANFSEKAFNAVFAIQYPSDYVYNEVYGMCKEEDTIRVVAKLYAISCFMGTNKLTVNSAKRDYGDTVNDYVYYCKDPSGNDFEITWDIINGNLTAYAPSTGKPIDGEMNLNDDTVILTYSVGVKEGYKYVQGQAPAADEEKNVEVD